VGSRAERRCRQQWLRELWAGILGKLDKTESTPELAMALRAAITEVRAQAHGDELQVDINVRAPDIPDVTIFAPAEVALVRRSPGGLNRGGRPW
jgi:hypothetical protein